MIGGSGSRLVLDIPPQLSMIVFATRCLHPQPAAGVGGNPFIDPSIDRLVGFQSGLEERKEVAMFEPIDWGRLWLDASAGRLRPSVEEVLGEQIGTELLTKWSAWWNTGGVKRQMVDLSLRLSRHAFGRSLGPRISDRYERIDLLPLLGDSSYLLDGGSHVQIGVHGFDVHAIVDRLTEGIGGRNF